MIIYCYRMTSFKYVALMALLFGSLSLALDSKVGVVRASIGKKIDNAYGIAVQPDGKILVAGASFNGKDQDAVLLRFFPDGTLDTRFGFGGVATYDSKKGDDKAYSLAVWWDGRIFLSGETSNGKDSDFALWRFSSDGKLDRKYGVNGVARADFGKGDDVALSMVLQPDGKIILGGTALGKDDKDFAMAKFIREGAPDISFGQNGMMITSLQDIQARPGDESGYGIITLPDGRIIQVGSSEIGGQSVMSLLRYFGDGRLDKKFGKKGAVFPSFPGMQTFAYGTALDSQQRLVVIGSVKKDNKRDLVILRILSNGDIDTEFGDYGKTVIPLPGTANVLYGIAFDDKKRIVVGGGIGSADRMELVTARLTEQGKIDTTFGHNGVLTFSDGKYDVAFSVGVQPDGKILSAGVTKQGEVFQVALLKLLADGQLDPYFGVGSRAIQSVGTPEAVAVPKTLFTLPSKTPPSSNAAPVPRPQ